MSDASSHLPAERQLQLESALLEEIVSRHPDRLTQDELTLRMAGGPAGTKHIAVLDALQELRRSGLIRFGGDVVEPTFAALRAAVVFDVP